MQIRRVITRILIGTLADAAIAAAGFRLHFSLATVTLLFVLSVVVQALGMTFSGAIAAALIAAAFIDYFFIPPFFTWRIANSPDVIALAAFIATALITSHLASSARQAADRAERRRKVLDQLCVVGQRLLALDSGEDVIRQTLRTAVEVFGLRAACIFDGRTAENILAGVSSTLSSQIREAYISGKDMDTSEVGTALLCIREAGNVTCAIGFEGFRDAGLAAPSLAALVTTTINRARAARVAAIATAEVEAKVFRTAILDALAHEFKTPLAVILAASGGLQEAGNLTSVQHDLAFQIEEESVRLGELTSSLLSRNEADYDQLQPRMEKFDLGLLLARVLERFTNHHPERVVRFVHDESGSISAAADEELLCLVVGQLLDNAAKYSGAESSIAVSLAASDNRIEIRVRNSGSIITPAERELVFQRFYRGARHRHVTAGSGLGLYVARRIAIAHGGTLTVEAMGALEDGTTFFLTLPLLQKNTPEGNTHYAGISFQSAGCR